MTIQQLKSFLAVCEEMNYSRAAQKCYISRQALRQNIMSLEEELCGALFVNNSNRIALTAKGLKLFNEALPVVEAYDRLEDTMLSDIRRTTELSLGVSYALVPDYLPTLSEHLELFSQQHRSVNLRVFYLNNDDIAPMIACGKLDCGVVMDLGSAAEGMNRVELSSHPANLLFSADSRFSESDVIDICDIKGESVCMPGLGAEMQPICLNDGIRTVLVPNYYQALYNVRENGYCLITRALDGRSEFKPFVHAIPLRGYLLCSSFICPDANERKEMKQLSDFLKTEIAKDFA